MVTGDLTKIYEPASSYTREMQALWGEPKRVCGCCSYAAVQMYMYADVRTYVNSAKWKQPYSTTIGWLRCRLSFCLYTKIINNVHQRCKIICSFIPSSVGSCCVPGSHQLASEAINRHCWNYLFIEHVLYHYFSSISPSFTYTLHCVGIGFGLRKLCTESALPSALRARLSRRRERERRSRALDSAEEREIWLARWRVRSTSCIVYCPASLALVRLHARAD